MVCLFCNCYFHKSKFCDVYITDDDRKVIADINVFCRFCFVKSTTPHYPKEEKCRSNENCVGWFSTEHHKLFCPERTKAFKKFFLPKIDQNLLQRFLETFDFDEKYSVVLSAPKNFNRVFLDQITVIDSFNHYINYTKYDIVVFNGEIKLNCPNLEKKLFNSIIAKTVICLSRILHFSESDISSNMILQLLSPYTRDLYFRNNFLNFEYPQKLSFSDIIEKAPNLDKIYYSDFKKNILFQKTWLKDLLRYKNGNNFQELDVELDAIELDVESLAQFFRTKCSKDAKIRIRFSHALEDSDENRKNLNEILEKINVYSFSRNEALVTMENKTDKGMLRIQSSWSANDFKLKKFLTIDMPNQVATKKNKECVYENYNKQDKYERKTPSGNATLFDYIISQIHNSPSEASVNHENVQVNRRNNGRPRNNRRKRNNPQKSNNSLVGSDELVQVRICDVP